MPTMETAERGLVIGSVHLHFYAYISGCTHVFQFFYVRRCSVSGTQKLSYLISRLGHSFVDNTLSSVKCLIPRRAHIVARTVQTNCVPSSVRRYVGIP